jgi:hypothetical protein
MLLTLAAFTATSASASPTSGLGMSMVLAGLSLLSSVNAFIGRTSVQMEYLLVEWIAVYNNRRVASV